jgi:putative hydrolase of the HAD superfamily
VPLDAVIFDYGKVISLDQDPGALAELKRISGLDGNVFHDLYWKHRDGYDAGLLSGASYWQIVAQEAGVEYSASQIEALIDTDNRSWSRTNPITLRWARELGDCGFKLGILSNLHKDLRDYLVEHCDWVKEFDHAVFSCDTGMVKPQQPIYELAVQGLGVPAGQALFLDDKKPNIDAAERAGLNGILVRNLPAAMREASDRFGLPVSSLAPGA